MSKENLKGKKRGGNATPNASDKEKKTSLKLFRYCIVHETQGGNTSRAIVSLYNLYGSERGVSGIKILDANCDRELEKVRRYVYLRGDSGRFVLPDTRLEVEFEDFWKGKLSSYVLNVMPRTVFRPATLNGSEKEVFLAITNCVAGNIDSPSFKFRPFEKRSNDKNEKAGMGKGDSKLDGKKDSGNKVVPKGKTTNNDKRDRKSISESVPDNRQEVKNVSVSNVVPNDPAGSIEVTTESENDQVDAEDGGLESAFTDNEEDVPKGGLSILEFYRNYSELIKYDTASIKKFINGKIVWHSNNEPTSVGIQMNEVAIGSSLYLCRLSASEDAVRISGKVESIDFLHAQEGCDGKQYVILKSASSASNNSQQM